MKFILIIWLIKKLIQKMWLCSIKKISSLIKKLNESKWPINVDIISGDKNCFKTKTIILMNKKNEIKKFLWYTFIVIHHNLNIKKKKPLHKPIFSPIYLV